MKTELKRGEIECPKCEGSGEINPPGTLNYPIACPDCSGTGKTRREHGRMRQPYCGGKMPGVLRYSSIGREGMDPLKIQVGDTVSINFNNACYTLSKSAEVLAIPRVTGDSWILKDSATKEIHYISEGCTLTKNYDPTPH